MCDELSSHSVVIDVSPSANSARRIVVTPRVDSRARSSALQRSRARAALIWALVRGFSCQYGCDRIDLSPNAIFRLGGRYEVGQVQKIRESQLFHWRLGRSDHHW